MEEAVEAVAALDGATVWSEDRVWWSQPEPAMWTLVMVVLEEVDEYAAEVALTSFLTWQCGVQIGRYGYLFDTRDPKVVHRVPVSWTLWRQQPAFPARNIDDVDVGRAAAVLVDGLVEGLVVYEHFPVRRPLEIGDLARAAYEQRRVRRGRGSGRSTYRRDDRLSSDRCFDPRARASARA